MKKIIGVIVFLVCILGVSIAVVHPMGKINEKDIENEIVIKDVSIDLVVGDTYNIELDNINQYKFESSDEKILSVSEDGIVTPLNPGKAEVKISRKNYKDKTITFNIAASAKSVELEYDYLTLEKNEKKELIYSVKPEGSKILNSYWFIEDTNIVDIQDNILVAKQPGKTTVKIQVNGNLEDTLEVEVKVLPESLKLEKQETTISVNDKVKLNYEILPVDTTEKKIKWVSDDNNIVSVDNNGNIKGISKGTTTIYAITSNNIKDKITVTVEAAKPSKVEFSKKSIDLYIGGTTTLSAKVSPDYAENKSVIYKSSNESVATIDENGKVVAKKVGSTTISAKTFNGKTGTIIVNVRNKTYNKKAIFFGDSIVYGMGASGYSWANYINDMYDLKEGVNAGKSGWLISNYCGKNWINTIVKQHKNEKYDYIILEGGTNDIQHTTPLGSFKENDFSGKYNAKTFLGGLETYIYTVKKQWPNAKIGYIITYQILNNSDKRRELSPSYYQELRKVLRKWNVPYLDLFSGDAYPGKSFSDLLEVTTKKYLPDTLHLNLEGYKVVSPYIYKWMNTL